MNPTPIHITPHDYSKLRLLVASATPASLSASLRKLREELDRAAITQPSELPAGVVTMESTVEFQDLATNEIESYTLAFPERANVEAKRLSVLAPIGTALIGYREGDVVSWSTPGGTRQLKILRVTPPAASTPAFAPLAFAGTR